MCCCRLRSQMIGWDMEIRGRKHGRNTRCQLTSMVTWSTTRKESRNGSTHRHVLHTQILARHAQWRFYLFQSVCWYLCELGFLLGMFLSFPSVGSGVLGQLSLASLRGRKIEYQLCWGKGGDVTSAGWQVTLWHVSSHSCVATLRSAIHLLLTYLLG